MGTTMIMNIFLSHGDKIEPFIKIKTYFDVCSYAHNDIFIGTHSLNFF